MPIENSQGKVGFLAIIAFLVIVANVGAWFYLSRGKTNLPSNQTATPTLSATPTPPNTTPPADDTKLIKQAILTKLGLTENQAVITINQIIGKHAKGGVREIEAVGGGYFLAAKVGENWMIVYDGQASPTCVQIAPYNFPIDIVPECLDASGKVIKR